MVFDAPLLNIQHDKVRIKGKVEQSRERSSALPLHICVEAIKKGAFKFHSTTVANFIFTSTDTIQPNPKPEHHHPRP